MGCSCYNNRKKRSHTNLVKKNEGRDKDTHSPLPKSNLKSKKKDEIQREVYIKGSNPNIPDDIIDALRNSVVRIELDEIRIFTGFFMKINLYEYEEQYNFLLTCYHSIEQKNIDSKKTMNIYFGKSQKEKQIRIELDKKRRIIISYEDLDVILIQMLKEDNIKEKRYLYPDLNYQNSDKYSHYLNAQVYLAGYPKVPNRNGKRYTSSGIINKVNESDFEHTCDTNVGSSGSPIINNEKLVIGIHFGGSKDKTKNYGYFIGEIIEKLRLEKKIKKNNPEENIINIKNENENTKLNENPNNIFQNDVNNFGRLMGALINDPNYMIFLKNFYSEPKIKEAIQQTPLFKNNPNLINIINEPEVMINAINKGNIEEGIKQLGISIENLEIPQNMVINNMMENPIGNIEDSKDLDE